MWRIFNPFKPKLIHAQVQEFLEWRNKISPTATASHKSNLEYFVKNSSFSDITKITEDDIRDFSLKQHTQYQIMSMKKSLLMCVAYHTRLKISPKHVNLISIMNTPRGRKPAIDKIRQVKKMREQGLSYRAIARIMHITPLTI
jgi:hypothetical protein